MNTSSEPKWTRDLGQLFQCCWKTVVARPIMFSVLLAMPISWRGTLAQYAGRLNRSSDGKSVVQIYDYVDVKIDKLYRMLKKRQIGYKQIGYKIQPLLQSNS